jgi:hypothetical protein
MQHRYLGKTAILISTALLTMTAAAQSCQSAGGMLLTNLGVVDAQTTMGYATGDLKGAVGATVLNFDSQNGGNIVVLTVQHHWVTESGDTLSFDQAVATAQHVGDQKSTLYGITNYQTHLKGGTGKFAGASGRFNNIGEVDLGKGVLVIRYTGYICFAQRN